MRVRRKPEFDALYRTHAREVYGWLYNGTGSHEVAADLTAETFARGLERYWRVVGGERASVAWIFGIARNVLREHRRDGRITASAATRLGISLEPLEPAPDGIESRLDAEALRPKLERALGGLPRDVEVTLRLRVIDELSYDEIAERLSCSEPAARQRVARALRALHLQLEGVGE